VRFVDLSRPDSVLQNLRGVYRRSHGTEISDQVLLAYDAVTLLGEAIASAGPKRESIRSWLSAVGADGKPFAGVTGPVAFANERDRAPGYVLVEAGQ
jgi:ABC-type branched-subunit amino acid transport system substrate-binding protein